MRASGFRNTMMPATRSGKVLCVAALLGVFFAGCSAQFAPQAEEAPQARGGGRSLGSSTADADAAQNQTADQRKIIYVADLRLVVRDFSPLPQQVQDLVDEHGGFIADAELSSMQGTSRTGMWKVRIPTDQYNPFLAAAQELGMPEGLQQTTEDVTETFIDLEAQASNKRNEEQRMLQLLENPAADLESVLRVEKEISRVRGEIERLEGRLRFLNDRTALTTVTIHAREVQDYVPPQAPTFTDRVATTWSGSLASLRVLGERTALFFVAIGPWSPLLLIAALIVWFVIRRFRKLLATPKPAANAA